jgi:hypothetical protein
MVAQEEYSRLFVPESLIDGDPVFLVVGDGVDAVGDVAKIAARDVLDASPPARVGQRRLLIQVPLPSTIE